MHDIVKLAMRDYYEKQINELLARRAVLYIEDDDYNALLLGEKIKELLQKLEELK